MGKRNLKWTEEKIAKRQKEGRGSGELSSYQPWLTTQDVPSIGRSHRIKGWKTNRLHHFFSDIERNYFYLLDWSENVIDIREQYPLYREKTIKIGEEKEFKHSVDPSTRTPIVMTTDFLITLKVQSNIEYIARTIKPSKELNNKRVIEKLEIERQYWSNEGIDWKIVSELDIPHVAWRNVEYLHQGKEIPNEDLLLAETLYNELKLSNGAILNVINQFENKYMLEAGSGIALFKYLLAKKIVKFDISREINFRIMEISYLTF